MKQCIIDGNQACAHVSYKFTELSGIYPITPASPIAESINSLSNKQEKNFFGETAKVVEMQSEAGAIALVHGALQSGVLATTSTASQGLLLMIPNLYKIAGELLPGVINVAARSLATHALSIFGDHQDIYATRQTGVAILYSSSVQQVMDLTSVSHLSAIKGSIPFINAFDGFRTSHELQKIKPIDLEKVEKLIDKKALEDFRKKALVANKKITRGTAQNDDVYFQNLEVRNKYYDELPNIVENYMNEINKITGQNYKPFNYYGDITATRVIVAMGSVCQTIKETIEYLNTKDEKLGLIEVHLYRPFSINHLKDVLPKTTEKIAVLDRTKECGSSGEPLYLDIVNALKEEDIEIIGGRYGISSKDVPPKDIKSVYDFLNNPKRFNGFTIGIIDDVTNKSIEIDEEFIIPNNNTEILIYGYGSDGMVSASKSIMKIIGEKTPKYVQGYFQYDSKKSGGVTRSHLRISDNPIESPYYIQKANIVVCTKASYINQFDFMKHINNNGIFILNTPLKQEDCLSLINIETLKKMKEKNIKFYTVDAYNLSSNNGLGNKISTIMETIIFKYINIIDKKDYVESIKEKVYEKFKTKGKEIIDANYKVIDLALESISEINISVESSEITQEKQYKNDIIIDSINKMEGNNVPVSAFLNHADGSYEGGNTVYEKRKISETVPVWIKENCIQCNQCSFVCPHSVIRPFLLNDEENKQVEGNSLKGISPESSNYNYMIGVSHNDCTGCTHCVQTCPGKNGEKALVMKNIYEIEKEQNDYLFTKVTQKEIERKNTVKYSQFHAPKFEYPGSCSGCGETPYLKVLTQLFGENLIISNATGCSSIYGASLPSTPYSIPWINSLFEDNAEMGYGIYTGQNLIRNKLKKVLQQKLEKTNDEQKEILKEYLENFDDIEITNKLSKQIELDEDIKPYKEYLVKPTVWCIGGDGWAYDIGYSGIDHILSTNENINILVLDTEVYSNTGGQSSKSSRTGSIAAFTETGKTTHKKDLAKIAMTNPNVFVAQISLGYNKEVVVKAFEEAAKHDGPSIIIAYAPCISHGIKGGMNNALKHQQLAGECGYLPVFMYNPKDKKLKLYNKEPDFNKYEEFLDSETRYSMLKLVNKENAEKLLNENKEQAKQRFNYYKELSERSI